MAETPTHKLPYPDAGTAFSFLTWAEQLATRTDTAISDAIARAIAGSNPDQIVDQVIARLNEPPRWTQLLQLEPGFTGDTGYRVIAGRVWCGGVIRQTNMADVVELGTVHDGARPANDVHVPIDLGQGLNGKFVGTLYIPAASGAKATLTVADADTQGDRAYFMGVNYDLNEPAES